MPDLVTKKQWPVFLDDKAPNAKQLNQILEIFTDAVNYLNTFNNEDLIIVNDGFDERITTNLTNINSLNVSLGELAGRITTLEGAESFASRVTAIEDSYVTENDLASINIALQNYSDHLPSGLYHYADKLMIDLTGSNYLDGERTLHALAIAIDQELKATVDMVDALTTTDIVEGSNLYYTDARVAASPAVQANTLKYTQAQVESKVTFTTGEKIYEIAIDDIIGPIPQHQWNGTELRFETAVGVYGSYVNLKGDKGDTGTSVTIKGTVTVYTDLPNSGQTLGDGYLLNGYLWTYTGVANNYTDGSVGDSWNGFENVGLIQGPQGPQGYNFIYNWSGTSLGVGTSQNPGVYNYVNLKGDPGDDGSNGMAATITVGTVTTGAAGTSVIITNVGTVNAAIFDFTIPKGDQGIQGIQGEPGINADSYIDDNSTAADKLWSASKITTELATKQNIIPANTYANFVHYHDDRYYTESEITSLLADKSDDTHNHNSDNSIISETSVTKHSDITVHRLVGTKIGNIVTLHIEAYVSYSGDPSNLTMIQLPIAFAPNNTTSTLKWRRHESTTGTEETEMVSGGYITTTGEIRNASSVYIPTGEITITIAYET